MSGVIGQLKDAYNSHVSGTIKAIAKECPKTYCAILIIGVLGALVAIYFSGTGIKNPFSVTNIMVNPIGWVGVPIIFVIGVPAIMVLVKGEDKQGMKYKCAQFVVSLLAVPVAFMLGNTIGGGFASQILHPFGNSITIPGTQFSIPIPLPIEMTNMMIQKVLLYMAGAGTALFAMQTNNSKNREYYETGMKGLAAAAIATTIVLATLACFGGKPFIFGLAGSLAPQTIAIAGVGTLFFLKLLHSLVTSRPVTKLSQEEWRDEVRKQEEIEMAELVYRQHLFARADS
jgi:hypothetical protein